MDKLKENMESMANPSTSSCLFSDELLNIPATFFFDEHHQKSFVDLLEIRGSAQQYHHHDLPCLIAPINNPSDQYDAVTCAPTTTTVTPPHHHQQQRQTASSFSLPSTPASNANPESTMTSVVTTPNSGSDVSLSSSSNDKQLQVGVDDHDLDLDLVVSETTTRDDHHDDDDDDEEDQDQDQSCASGHNQTNSIPNNNTTTSNKQQ